MSKERIEKDFLESVGHRFKPIRENKNLTQEQVYEATQINLDRIENAKTNYSLSTFHILCKFYEISPEEFFKGL